MKQEWLQDEAFVEGLKTRKKVLGDDYVEQALSHANHFTAPLQKIITQWAWHENWNRTALTHRERSMIMLALMTAMNRPAELRIHLRGAINNGLTSEEIQDVLLQTAAYCGIPAALDSFMLANEMLNEYGMLE